jgi:hypothetical protein
MKLYADKANAMIAIENVILFSNLSDGGFVISQLRVGSMSSNYIPPEFFAAALLSAFNPSARVRLNRGSSLQRCTHHKTAALLSRLAERMGAVKVSGSYQPGFGRLANRGASGSRLAHSFSLL